MMKNMLSIVVASIFMSAALVSTAFAQQGTTVRMHDCDITCIAPGLTTTQCTAYVDEDHDHGSLYTNCANWSDVPYLYDNDPHAYVSGTGHCNQDWTNGSFVRLLCSEYGNGGICSISGNMRCTQPGGGTALRGYSIGCSHSSRIPQATGTRDVAHCRGDQGSQTADCGPDGNVWVSQSQ